MTNMSDVYEYVWTNYIKHLKTKQFGSIISNRTAVFRVWGWCHWPVVYQVDSRCWPNIWKALSQVFAQWLYPSFCFPFYPKFSEKYLIRGDCFSFTCLFNQLTKGRSSIFSWSELLLEKIYLAKLLWKYLAVDLTAFSSRPGS